MERFFTVCDKRWKHLNLLCLTIEYAPEQDIFLLAILRYLILKFRLDMQGIYFVDHPFNFCMQFLPDCKLKIVVQNILVNVIIKYEFNLAF